MAEPLVSVCIPNYNNGRYLDECIRSALAQTYRQVEIVFVDDASTDESVAVARRYEGRVRISVNAENLGQPATTNNCVAASRGTYVAVLHSDDALLPHFLTTLVPLLEACPSASMAVGERLERDDEDPARSITPFYDQSCLIPGEKQAKVFLFASFLPCQVLIRRTAFQAAGGVHERHVVNLDGLLWFKMALQGDVAYVPDAVGVYRLHSAQTTARYNRTIDHMFEYYDTLREMFRLGRGRPYLEQHFGLAVRRVGELTLRYSHASFHAGDMDLLRRYLALATAFDPALEHSFEYVALKGCMEAPEAARAGLYARLFGGDARVRKHSYPPPEGFTPLPVPS